MKISASHQQFADHLGNQRALDHPEEFLGPNWKDVINFWIFLDTLSKEQREIIREHYWAVVRIASYRAARNAALEATNKVIVDSVWWAATSCYATSATNELIGSHILTAQGKSLVFLPLCLTV